MQDLEDELLTLKHKYFPEIKKERLNKVNRDYFNRNINVKHADKLVYCLGSNKPASLHRRIKSYSDL